VCGLNTVAPGVELRITGSDTEDKTGQATNRILKKGEKYPTYWYLHGGAREQIKEDGDGALRLDVEDDDCLRGRPAEHGGGRSALVASLAEVRQAATTEAVAWDEVAEVEETSADGDDAELGDAPVPLWL
jgi:hypothetical protein